MSRRTLPLNIKAQLQDQSCFAIIAEVEATEASAYRCVMSAVKNQSQLNAEPTSRRQELYEGTYGFFIL